MSALDWIGQLAETIIKCFPHLKIVQITQGGIKLRRGNEITELVPGPVWYWPIYTVVNVVTTVRDTMDLPGQTFTTKDGKTVLCSGMVQYKITDVVKLLTTAPDYVNTIGDLVMTAMHDTFIKYTWEELKDGIVEGSIRKEMRKAAQDELSGFGVKVISVGLKDNALARVIKIVQDV